MLDRRNKLRRSRYASNTRITAVGAALNTIASPSKLDSVLLEYLNSSAAAAAVPLCSDMFKSNAIGAALIRNTTSLFGLFTGQSSNVQPLASLLGVDVPSNYMVDKWGISRSMSTKSKETQKREAARNSGLVKQRYYTTNADSSQFPDIEVKATVKYLKGEMFVPSGSATDTYHLKDSYEHVYEGYRKVYCEILKKMYLDNERDLVDAGSEAHKIKRLRAQENCRLDGTKMTILQCNIEAMLCSLNNHQVPGWTKATAGRKARVNRATTLRPNVQLGETIVVDGPGIGSGMEVNDLCIGHYVAYADLSQDLDDDDDDDNDDDEEDTAQLVQNKSTFTPETWVMSPRPYRRFWKFAKDEKIKIKRVTTPYTCEICDRDPIARAEFQRYTDKAAKYKTKKKAGRPPKKITKNSKRLKILHEEIMELDRHRLQLQHQRNYVQKRIHDLPAKTASCFKVVVIEDYMSQNTILGGKVTDLIFTILWRDEAGNLQTKYVDNICNDASRKTDSGFTRAIWDFHLREINGTTVGLDERAG
jgi:hypothetical protein